MVISLASFGQKQANIWYFGIGAGLDFNSGSPVVLVDGQTMNNGIYNPEGTTTISDSTGSLLFYSDGEKVWNKNHQVMPHGNGILGHVSSTQAALAVPQPESPNRYYLFTTDAFIHSYVNGLRYSVIDMCDAGGLGDVDTMNKNVLLLSEVSEKLVATQHSNGADYWIVSLKHFTNKYYAYKLTMNGIVDSVVSALGPVDYSNTGFGQMKISPNGSKLAVAYGQTGNNLDTLAIFDFDNSTGQLTNPINFSFESKLYGVAFSPDNSKLYVGKTFMTGAIFQIDLSSNYHVDTIPIPNNTLFSGMQLGPDGKIYVVQSPDNYVSVINQPNNSGVNCDFVYNALYLEGGRVIYSFPGFIDNFNYPQTVPSCHGSSGVEKKEALSWSLAPNPFNQYTKLEFENPNNKKYIFTVSDATGRLVKTMPNIKDSEVIIEKGNLKEGLYFFSLDNSGSTLITGKFVVSR